MKKILLAIGTLDVGGSEKQIVALASGLVQKGYECRLFVLNGYGKLRSYLEEIGVPIIHAWNYVEKKRRPSRIAMAQLKFIHETVRYKPDIIHAFLPLVTFMGATAGRLCNTPLVITGRRALGKHQERHHFLRPLDLLANSWSHLVTVNSKAVWNDVVRRDNINPQKLVLIYNSIDPKPYESAGAFREKTRQILGIKPEEKAVICIANLIPYKGHSDLISATALALKDVPEIKLLVVGQDRGIGDRLKGQADMLGIRPVVKFLGQRLDTPELLAASDLSVIASHEEGFSNVILESMAAGLPVVATDVGGNRESIVDGGTGWLVPPKAPSVLAAKVVDLLNDPSRATQWGKRGRRRIKKLFTVEKMIDSHLKLYEASFAYPLKQ